MSAEDAVQVAQGAQVAQTAQGGDPSRQVRQWMRDLSLPTLFLAVIGLAFNAGAAYQRLNQQDEKLRELQPIPTALARIDATVTLMAQDVHDLKAQVQQPQPRGRGQ